MVIVNSKKLGEVFVRNTYIYGLLFYKFRYNKIFKSINFAYVMNNTSVDYNDFNRYINTYSSYKKRRCYHTEFIDTYNCVISYRIKE